MTEHEAMAHTCAMDRLDALANKSVPMLLVYGDMDEVVPPRDNTLKVASRYKALGGEVTLVRKPGKGHHPHGSPKERIVHFLLNHTSLPGQSIEFLATIRRLPGWSGRLG